MSTGLFARAAERLPVPDRLTRAAIGMLVGRTDRALTSAPEGSEARFAAGMPAFPIALHTEAANRQHYEVPAAFFEQVLGPRRKYSCCLYPEATTTLAEAEDIALAETAAHADLHDGQRVLELGCGWGSLSLWTAARFPASRITAVSNSHSQRAYIESRARALGLVNLEIVTADMTHFAPEGLFDRIVSVEMFEHMANWRDLLGRVRGWLLPEGRLFIHVFTHRAAPYRFDPEDGGDWIAQHFFSGGIMPSHGLIGRFPDLFALEADWRGPGPHSAGTARDWLANFDRNRAAIPPILRAVYGAEASVWARRWRLFFLATEGLFGHAGGAPWGVSHYRLAPTPA